MVEKFLLNVLMSLAIFFLLTSPHIIYMITYDSNIYVNSSGEVVKDITAYGFRYSLVGILTCSFLSVVFGKLLTNRITK